MLQDFRGCFSCHEIAVTALFSCNIYTRSPSILFHKHRDIFSRAFRLTVLSFKFCVLSFEFGVDGFFGFADQLPLNSMRFLG
jgi:hypothetical protein